MIIDVPVAERHKPLTKSIDIAQVLDLFQLANHYAALGEWRKAALQHLPQVSRSARQDTVRFAANLLTVESSTIQPTPQLRVWTAPQASLNVKRDLLFLYYLRATPLAWQAAAKVVLRYAEAGAAPLAKPDASVIPAQVWDAWLRTKLPETTAASSRVKTRNHLTAHFTKFGIMEPERVGASVTEKRFHARFFEPDPRVFIWALALEYLDHGWVSRSLDYATTKSWARQGFCTTTAFARFAVEEAEGSGWAALEFFGSERLVTLRLSGLLESLADAMTDV